MFFLWSTAHSVPTLYQNLQAKYVNSAINMWARTYVHTLVAPKKVFS
jgi:hypothetical protein